MHTIKLQFRYMEDTSQHPMPSWKRGVLLKLVYIIVLKLVIHDNSRLRNTSSSDVSSYAEITWTQQTPWLSRSGSTCSSNQGMSWVCQQITCGPGHVQGAIFIFHYCWAATMPSSSWILEDSTSDEHTSDPGGQYNMRIAYWTRQWFERRYKGTNWSSICNQWEKHKESRRGMPICQWAKWQQGLLSYLSTSLGVCSVIMPNVCRRQARKMTVTGASDKHARA